MRAAVFICLILAIYSRDVFAQTSPVIRRLPPSLERELKLRKGGRVRVIGFTDTLKAQNLIAQSIRDSSSEELDSMTVRDSAIILIDSSVSLTDKEWLDSMLAELPEYRMTPEGIRFYYPADVLVETNRKTVPPDTTLASRMDPVSKEDLPLYDASPMPRPFRQTPLLRSSVELGVGQPYLPRIDIRSLIVSSDRSEVELDGKYRLTGSAEPAIKQFWQIGGSGNFAFPNASPDGADQIPQLGIDVRSGANKRLVISENDSTTHTLSQTNLNADFTIGSPSQLKLRAHGSMGLLNDDVGIGSSENQAAIELALLKDIPNSSYRLQLDAAFRTASAIGNVLSASPTLFNTEIILRQKETEPFEWKAGIGYAGGSDATGSVSSIYPLISLRTHISRSIELGAGFEPQPQLVGLESLLARNIFYSPVLAAKIFPNDSPFPGDYRRIATEPVHIDIFANYFLTLDNEVHAEFRFIERRHEPVFDVRKDSTGHSIFIVDAWDTRRYELEFGGKIMLFGKDRLRASLLLRSATGTQGVQPTLPFEPNTQLQAIYQFGNISEKFIPQIEFMNISRMNRSLSFFNFEAPYVLSPQFRLRLRAENIFGNAGDFWTGYNEYPRSVWLSAQYSF